MTIEEPHVRRRVTLADVAARAQVDRSVISRVVNGDPTLSIRPATRARVLAAVEELAYRPNAAARSLRTKRSSTFGLFIPDYANPVYGEIIKGAELAAAERDCVLVTGSSRVAGGPSSYLDLLGDGRVDGLLLAGDVSAKAVLERLRASQMPWLLVNWSAPGVSRHIVLDDEGAAAMAVRHLVGLGHSQVAHLAGPSISDTAKRRARGYRTTMRACGLAPDPAFLVRADYTPEGGFQAMRRLLELPRRPTAVFVANVASAIGALRAAHGSGLRVPVDLSIVAVHDLPLVEYLTPSLTTVRMPLEQLGRRAVELLASTLPNECVTETVDGDMELVLRESTAAPSEA